MNKWFIKRNRIHIKKMSDELKINPITANVLANRGIASKELALSYLFPKEKYHNSEMKDFDKAVNEISDALNKELTIAVFGDYDADGILSTYIIYNNLKKYSPKVSFYIPDRVEEGYGLNETSIDILKKDQIDLLICCDNGTASYEEAKILQQMGINLIVIDHHEEQEQTLEALALVNPKQKTCPYPFKHLCSAALAYKLMQALHKKRQTPYDECEDLVFAGIATICDVTDLTDENRYLVKKALYHFPSCPNIGLEALLKEINLYGKEMDAEAIAFQIGPILNAAGRLDTAERALSLLLQTDRNKACEEAKTLIAINEKRKKLTNEACEIARSTILNANMVDDSVFVVFNENIHESIAGIVAGKLKDEYNKPCLIITKGKNFAKGSARSISEYNIFDALQKESDLFERFGGHAQAAGYSLKEEAIPVLRSRLNSQAFQFEKKYRIDAKLSIDKITSALYHELNMLEPFGKANERPLFGDQNVFVQQVKFLGPNKKIIKFQLKKERRVFPAVAFHSYHRLQSMLEMDTHDEEEMTKRILHQHIDILYYVDGNTYKNNEYLQLVLEDFRYS